MNTRCYFQKTIDDQPNLTVIFLQVVLDFVYLGIGEKDGNGIVPSGIVLFPATKNSFGSCPH